MQWSKPRPHCWHANLNGNCSAHTRKAARTMCAYFGRTIRRLLCAHVLEFNNVCVRHPRREFTGVQSFTSGRASRLNAHPLRRSVRVCLCACNVVEHVIHDGLGHVRIVKCSRSSIRADSNSTATTFKQHPSRPPS